MFAATLVSQSKSGNKAMVVCKFNGKSVTRHVAYFTGTWLGKNPDDSVPAKRTAAEKAIAGARAESRTAEDNLQAAKERLAALEGKTAENVAELMELLSAKRFVKALITSLGEAADIMATKVADTMQDAMGILRENPEYVEYELKTA